MRVLFVGDIVGEPGRKAVAQLVPRLRRSEQIDCVIANGENAAGGSGITGKTAIEILNAGVDVITLGDHAWDQKEIMTYIPGEPRLLRPLNYPHGAPGRGSGLFQFPSQAPIVVINLQGRAFMGDLDNPFLCAEAEVARARARTPIIVVDMHHGEPLVSQSYQINFFLKKVQFRLFPSGSEYTLPIPKSKN